LTGDKAIHTKPFNMLEKQKIFKGATNTDLLVLIDVIIEKALTKDGEIYGLAERLHKTVSEILQMSVEEFNMWIAYFQIQQEERERQERLAKASR
jgi:hypothetical protein